VARSVSKSGCRYHDLMGIRGPVVMVVALSLAACGGGAPTSGSPAAGQAPSTAVTAAVAPSTAVPERTTTTSAPTTTSTTAAPPETTTTTALTTESLGPHESLAARADAPLDVFEEPGAAEPFVTLPPATDLGTPRVVRVLEGPADGWMRVSLPMRPNGSEGWIAASDVSLFRLDRRVEIDLGGRRLRVVSADGVLLETAVAIGSTASPTPVGTFFVTDSVIVGDPGGPWGPHAFGLSAYSDTVTEFNGGNGIIGVHGTNRPDSIGHAQSLGCVRVPNDVATELAGLISAGVVVRIEA
jgi:lipoprotein-anchoring transpeptidase ErfK/SrfK